MHQPGAGISTTDMATGSVVLLAGGVGAGPETASTEHE